MVRESLKILLAGCLLFFFWQVAAREEEETENCPKAQDSLTRWCSREIPTASLRRY